MSECDWTYDPNTCAWGTACGELWQFTDGSPEDNNVRFCHGCGKPVRIIPEGGSDGG